MKNLLLTRILLLVSAGSLRADTITGIYGGTIDKLGFPPFPPIEATDYGLGIDIGNHFIGKFSYESDAIPIGSGGGFARYEVSSFEARITNVLLTAINATLNIGSDFI